MKHPHLKLCLPAALCVAASLALAKGGYAPDYLLKPVPPALTEDARTTYLLDRTAPSTPAPGDGLVTATIDPLAFTVEMVVKLQAGKDASRLGSWSVPGVYQAVLTTSGFTLSGQGALRPFALHEDFGGNGFSLMKDGLDQWVYLAFGADLSNRLVGSAVRTLDGNILKKKMNFAWQDGLRMDLLASLPAAEHEAAIGKLWADMAAAVQAASGTGRRVSVTLGGPQAEVQKLRISKGFRSDVLAPQPDLAINGSDRTFQAKDIASNRVVTASVSRTLGYEGYHNEGTFTISEDSIAMSPGDSVTINLGPLSIGLYSLHVYGTIDPRGRSTLERVWKPCPMEFEVTDGTGRKMAGGRRLLKQSFRPQRMQGFDFHVDAPGSLTATFRVTSNAMETARLQRIAFIDQLKGLPDVAVKSAQNLSAGSAAKLTDLTQARLLRDDAIWAALPPLNLHYQVHAQEKSFQSPPSDLALPRWEAVSAGKLGTNRFVPINSAYAIRQSFAKLDLINRDTGEIFPHESVVAGLPWPGPRPDDGTGIFLTKAEFTNLPHDIYYAPRAEILGQRIRYYLGLLGAGDYGGNSLPAKYTAEGDPGVGHDAALALVRLAYDWPAMEMNLHELRLSTHSPDFEFNTDWASSRNGKYFYEGWSGNNTVALLQAYDQVFPYIQSNTVFSAAVHRFIPWVNTPEDVIRLMDRYLVFASVRDLHRGRIRAAPVEDVAAQVLGPHPLTAPMMDLTKALMELYPYHGPFQELYGCALSRSGVYHIGSFMTYAFGSALDTVDKGYLASRAKAKGVPLPMDLSDLQRYPKVKSASDFLIDMWIAGGFPFMVGDASGGPHCSYEAKKRIAASAAGFAKAFSLTGDPRHAWLLQNVIGRTNADVVAAAAGVADPILHNPSRVVPDYGAILEQGVAATNLAEKTAAVIRLGVGQGHAHGDYLDLNLFGLGLPLAVDLACRNEGDNWSRPGAGWAFLHNHALAHDTDNPKDASQNGDPWLRHFAPPLVRTAYENGTGKATLLRDTLLMEVADSGTYYAFDAQRLAGDRLHTWCFHGCESEAVELNVPMQPATNRWMDRLLEGTTRSGIAGDSLQAVWTMTRTPSTVDHHFNGGGKIKLAACEPAVLGARYDPALPPVKVRATLLGCAGNRVMAGSPYSERYQYAFPFLWVQQEAQGESLFPAIYDWYRGTDTVVQSATLVSREPLVVKVRLANGQSDTYTVTTNSFSAVSRDARGVRWAKLSGISALQDGDLSLTVNPAAYSATILDIDYAKRSLVLDRPLPANPAVTIGNPGRRIYLKLKGTGTQFTWDDDLLANEGLLETVTITGPDSLELTSSQPLFMAGIGNRKPAGYTVINEAATWHFRGGKVVRKPAGAALNEGVFTDANGDGLVNVKTYEMGIGDSVDLPSEVTLKRTADGIAVTANAGIEGQAGPNRISAP